MEKVATIRSVIVEDERKGREFLRELLQKYCPQVEVVGEADSVTAAVQLIDRVKPSLVFLDVEMPVHNGFKLFDMVPEINFDVIFVTAFDQYAVKAFEFSAVDYVLKPIRISKLKQAVEKVTSRMENCSRNQRVETLHENRGADFDKIVSPAQTGYQFVRIDEIVHCEAYSNYTHFYLSDGRKILASKTLKLVEELLADRDFFRIHQSHLINLRHVRSYLNGRSGHIEMDDGSVLDVSVRRKAALLEKIKSMVG